MRVVISILLVSILATIGLGAWLLWPQIEFYQLTGNFYPVRIVEFASRTVAA
jgi:hypothetical protein